MKTRFLKLAVAVLFLAGCSRGYDSATLGVKWKPPEGFTLAREIQSGPWKVADFGSGLRLYSLDVDLHATEGAIAMDQARTTVGLPPAQLLDCQAGQLPAGKMIRCQLHQFQGQELAVLLPQGARTLLVDLVAPASQYAALSAKVDAALPSLSAR